MIWSASVVFEAEDEDRARLLMWRIVHALDAHAIAIPGVYLEPTSLAERQPLVQIDEPE